jgi:large subunit ribosomal protein L21
MQYAIIETGGKQYQVEVGKSYEFELLTAEGQVTFDKVLLFVDGEDVQLGTPYLKDFTVEGKLEETVKGDKIDILRYKSKSRYRKHTGHRQKYSKVTIEAIGALKAATSSKKSVGPVKKTVTKKVAVKKTTAKKPAAK